MQRKKTQNREKKWEYLKMELFEAGQISRAARRMHSSLTNQRAICSLNYDRFPQKF